MSATSDETGRPQKGVEWRVCGAWLRLFSWRCGVVLTPPAFGRKVYLRWVFAARAERLWGVHAFTDDDGELNVTVGLWPLHWEFVLVHYGWKHSPLSGLTEDVLSGGSRATS